MDLPTQFQERLDALGVLAGDVEEQFIRGSGPGGQKINKTSSTVRLRHGPTGIEVRCQRERSQAANRETAWAELCAKLEAVLRKAEAARRDAREKARRKARPKSRRQKAVHGGWETKAGGDEGRARADRRRVLGRGLFLPTVADQVARGIHAG